MKDLRWFLAEQIQESENDLHTSGRGFTLVEVIIVVVILSIAAMMAIPMMSSAGSVQIRSAADAIAADLEYARSMAISRQQNYGIIFNPDNDKYDVVDQSDAVVPHPVKRGFPYTINFRSDSRLNKVDLVTADFGGSIANKIYFDYLGSPLKSDFSQLNSGTIVLQGGGSTITITVEPVTGFISISN
ncbi:MAG: GspH/FimT family pseudopilin [Planctomycetota bacterium]|nr:GspH/FimT family pseudopilin [Planctomycetota bacterium]